MEVAGPPIKQSRKPTFSAARYRHGSAHYGRSWNYRGLPTTDIQAAGKVRQHWTGASSGDTAQVKIMGPQPLTPNANYLCSPEANPQTFSTKRLTPYELCLSQNNFASVKSCLVWGELPACLYTSSVMMIRPRYSIVPRRRGLVG